VLVILEVAGSQTGSPVGVIRLLESQPLVVAAVFLYKKGRSVTLGMTEVRLDVPPPHSRPRHPQSGGGSKWGPCPKEVRACEVCSFTR
jgi:hypothetical protein